MKAIGITSKGEKLEFPIKEFLDFETKEVTGYYINAGGKDLVSLELPNFECVVYCIDNKLEYLHIPEKIVAVECDKKVKGLEKYASNCILFLG